jgi:hypothetical protein
LWDGEAERPGSFQIDQPSGALTRPTGTQRPEAPRRRPKFLLVLRLDHLVNPIRRFTERHGRMLGADLLDLAEYVVNIHGMPDPSVRIAEKVQARPEAPTANGRSSKRPFPRW